MMNASKIEEKLELSVVSPSTHQHINKSTFTIFPAGSLTGNRNDRRMAKSTAYLQSGDPASPAAFLVAGFFFFNTFLLPAGLLYTTLLTPLFLLLLLKKGKWKALLWFAVLSAPIGYFHSRGGADMAVYARSFALFASAVVFTIWVCHFLLAHKDKLGEYFRVIVVYNTFLTAMAILLLPVPGANEFFWYFEPIHTAIPAFPRLKLLVYESSFYSLQLAPVFLFYFASIALTGRKPYLLSLLLLGFSLLISLSFGILGGLTIAVLLVFFLHPFSLLRRRRIFFTSIYLALFGALLLALILYYFPFNPVFDRIEKVMQGHDSSAKGRTWEAFLLAWAILGETDYWLGAGLGQIKVAGHELIVNYYQYEGKWTDLVRIPNAMAETLATFGIVGAAGRVIAQIGLFFYTKVYGNYYRLMLFAFIFIYQFTGSYLTNIYEYLIWVIVFLPVFPQFDKRPADQPDG